MRRGKQECSERVDESDPNRGRRFLRFDGELSVQRLAALAKTQCTNSPPPRPEASHGLDHSPERDVEDSCGPAPRSGPRPALSDTFTLANVTHLPSSTAPRTRRFFSVLALTAGLAFGLPASAQKKYDPGASDAEIKVGQTMPYSGPASPARLRRARRERRRASRVRDAAQLSPLR